ncbi:MAG: tetratricopeptide repeat protein [Armatimonadota bacterium]|nr:tetratricopeptide repeat protein [bacterium]
MSVSPEEITKEKAVNLLKSGRIDEAISALENVAQLYPNDPQIHSYLGMAFNQKGNVDQSAAAFEKSLHLQQTPKAHYNLGLAYNAAGKTDDAAEQFRRAVALDPNYTLAQDALRKHTASATSTSVPAAAGEATVTMNAGSAIGIAPDPIEVFATPKAPPDLTQEKIRKELEWQERRRDMIKAGAIYGAIAGAFFLVASFFLVGIFSVVPAILMSKVGTVVFLTVTGIIGAIYGAIIGLWIGYTCGGEDAGLRAGAVIGAVAGLLSGLITGMGAASIIPMAVDTIVSGALGFMIGKIVETSVN